MSKTIEIIVAANGQTRVETRGFVGSDCREGSQFIERALGQRTDEILKSEFYQASKLNRHVKEGQ